MRNIWRRVNGVIGNVQEVTMPKSVCKRAKGPIRTVTHSWKPVCRSPCLLQQPSKITLSICNQWRSCWGKEVLSARQSDGAGSHVSRSVFRTCLVADCTAGMIWTKTHGHSMFSHNDNVPDACPQICICKKYMLCLGARMSKSDHMCQQILSKGSSTVCACVCVKGDGS